LFRRFVATRTRRRLCFSGSHKFLHVREPASQSVVEYKNFINKFSAPLATVIRDENASP